jgi:cytidylate kinase
MVVAIDGPAGAGKSTVARALADALGFTYLDSGAMYRAVALQSLRSGKPAAEEARSLDTSLLASPDIRSPEVSEAASRVATDPAVRSALVERQRELMADGDWVAEGRDIGTVVAPDAELKVFLTASASERARRRAEQLGADVEEVLAEQEERDRRDETREHSPLAAARDALRVDTDGLGVDEVVQKIVRLATAVR